MSPAQTILLSGANGLIGSALRKALSAKGHTVRTLSRSSGDVLWDVSAGDLPEDALDGVDVIVHLAGEPIAQRWTTEAKKKIVESRVKSTQLLSERAAAQAKRPALVLASGSNYYGYDCEELVDESAASGGGFLAEVCRAWEGAAQLLRDADGRVVMVRTGIVLSAEGGALAKMLPPFKLGVGGKIASGKQRMSWIGLEDLVAVYCLAVEDATVTGPINAVAPNFVTNLEFTKTLGGVLGRPTIFPLPGGVVELLFGEMGKETVLGNLGVEPRRLRELGFTWKTADLKAALESTLTD